MARAFRARFHPTVPVPRRCSARAAVSALRCLTGPLARSRARLSSTSRIASHSNFTTASSDGKCPRFLMIFLSWKFRLSIAFVV